MFYQQGNRGLKKGTKLWRGDTWAGELWWSCLTSRENGSRLSGYEAERCPEDLKMQTQCLFFPLAFFQTLFTHRCVYTGRVRSLKSGCARYCNATVQVRSSGPHSWASAFVRGHGAHGLGNVFPQGNCRGNSLHGVQVTPFPAPIPPVLPSHS